MILYQFLCLGLIAHPFPISLCVTGGGVGERIPGSCVWKSCVAGSCDTRFSSSKERHQWEIRRQMGRRSQGISALLSTLGSSPGGSSAPWLPLCWVRPLVPVYTRGLWLCASVRGQQWLPAAVHLSMPHHPVFASQLFRHLC